MIKRTNESASIPVLDESLIQRLIRAFRALCDTNRLNLLARLAGSGSTQNVRSMAGCCPLDQSVVSRHLSAMREAGVVNAERRGKEVHYSVNVPGIADLLRTFADAIENCCPAKKTQKPPMARHRHKSL